MPNCSKYETKSGGERVGKAKKKKWIGNFFPTEKGKKKKKVKPREKSLIVAAVRVLWQAQKKMD